MAVTVDVTTPLEVVVVAYGPVGLLKSCLERLGSSFPVHVIDNGRSEDVASLCRRLGVDYLRPAANIGFAAAVNLGLARRKAAADVLLLNPDALLEPESALALQRALHERQRTAAVAPVLQRPDGSREPTRWPFPRPSQPWRGLIGRGALRDGEDFFLSGAVLLLSADALSRVGPFDERFFLYAEETDWQRRALEADFSVREVSGVTAHHMGAGTSRDTTIRDIHFHGSAELYVRKWFGDRGWLSFRIGSLLSALRRCLTARTSTARSTAARAAWLYVKGPASRLPMTRR